MWCPLRHLQKYTDADVERADRELARLFVEMFDVIGDQVVSKNKNICANGPSGCVHPLLLAISAKEYPRNMRMEFTLGTGRGLNFGSRPRTIKRPPREVNSIV